MSDEQQQDFDILAFDAVADAEAGYDYEVKHPDGTGTGVILQIIGSHADEITRWNTRLANAMLREQAMATKRGKPAEPKPIEELREQNIEGAAMRVVGWRGVKQAFDRELMKQALRRNPHWIEQIVRESEDLGNFIGKRSPK